MTKLLRNYWYIVACERDVRQKPQRVTLFDKHYVVFANGNNHYTALQDRCPHRNVPLSAGKVCDGQLQCPYHGWRFDGKGRLVGVPALPPEAVPEIHIPTAHCVAQDGYIWLCIGTPTHSAPLPFIHLNEAGWSSFRMRTRFPASVAQCLENFLDCPHAVYVHESWFRAPTGKPIRARLRHLDDGAQIEYQNEPREKSWVWRLLQNSASEMTHSDRFIAPATSRVEYRFSDNKHYIITSSCTPCGERDTEVHTVISFRFGRIAPLIRLFFEPLARLIIRQDVDILQKQHDNIRRFGGHERFYHSAADVLLPSILAWRKALDEGTEPPQTGVINERELYL